MCMPMLTALNKVKYIVLVIMMIFVWSLFFMIYTDRFISPFDRLIPWLIPTKSIHTMATDNSMRDRMLFMQDILDASHRVSNGAFVVMVVSFGLFIVQLTFVYQQKQRRFRENRILHLKNQEIARRNEFIRYISATIGHEFKNNLARIKRRLDLMPEIAGESRERINGNLDHLFADIRIFKKISDEREEELYGFTRVYMRNMLVNIADHYSDLADVTFQDEFYPPLIYASSALLNSVFENLFDNAIKFKKPDQSKAQIVVTYSLDKDGRRSYLTLSFRDMGLGMDEMQAEQCFYKGLGSETGWGQGLYFAKYVIGLHAGKIRVGKEHTAPGTGTEIIINLPFVEEALDV
jgi:signal transduction histidine kinase